MANNLVEDEEVIQDHICTLKSQDEPVSEENDFSVVDSAQFDFNMNNAYDDSADVNSTTGGSNQATHTVELVDQNPDEDEDLDLDIPILELVARERGET